MIKRAEDMVREIKDSMRGGQGQVALTHLFKPGEFQGKARLCARITLEPGCSIGFHEHVHEEEIYYIISGQAVLTDSAVGSDQTLRAGDASITLDGQRHAIRNDSQETLELLALILLHQ